MLLLSFSLFLVSVNALWPIPRQLTTGTSALTIDYDAFSIDVSDIQNPPEDLQAAVSRTRNQIFEDNLGRLVVGRGASDKPLLETAPSLKKLRLSLDITTNNVVYFESNKDGNSDVATQIHERAQSDPKSVMGMAEETTLPVELKEEVYTLKDPSDGSDPVPVANASSRPRGSSDGTTRIHGRAQNNQNSVKSIAEETALPVELRDEGYTLKVPSDGSDAILVANTTLGLLRGLTTFSQLWYKYDDWLYSIEAPFEIVDAPYYKWRGLLFDTARNFFPVDDIKRTLDAMSWTKLNMFHWHIVDSQSFPLVLPELPELAQNGAYSATQQYSTSELDDIIAYAAARGIDVMMEIDTPGHTAVIHNTYPEYIACFEASPWTSYANEPPSGQLRLTEPDVIDFTKKLFKAAVKHTPGKYFSTGGDEINQKCYNEDPVVQATLSSSGKTFQQALATFTNETHKVLVQSGKTPAVWQEMVLAHGDLELSPETVVLVWISSSDAKAVAEAGYKIVHAPSDYFYLDCGQGQWIGDYPTGNSWCDPFKTWQKAYTFDPKANLTESEATLVLGGQSLLWTEQSDPNNLDPVLWPRAAAAAEVFWTGPTHPNGKPLDGTEALPRLHDLRYRYVHRGVKAIPLQPEYCALRPHACDLNA